jgi:hypothetical protein
MRFFGKSAALPSAVLAWGALIGLGSIGRRSSLLRSAPGGADALSAPLHSGQSRYFRGAPDRGQAGQPSQSRGTPQSRGTAAAARARHARATRCPVEPDQARPGWVGWLE